MAYALSWMADVLRAACCAVNDTSAPWKTHAHGDFGKPLGILIHHTAGPAHGNIPSLKTLIDGRPDLVGPLCNLGLARDGTYYCISAGKAWHAGYGAWRDVKLGYWGNEQMIGIECENTGLPDDPWPDVQMDALRKGCAALLKKIGRGVEDVAGHLEYAKPAGRKVDPSFSMDAFRASLAQPALT